MRRLLGWTLFLPVGLVAATGPAIDGLPLRFEPGDGPAPFLARGLGYTVAISPAAVMLRVAGRASVRLSLGGANKTAQVQAEEPLPGLSNYFVGPPSSWRRGVPQFARVKIAGIYPGIDLVYYGNQDQLEYDFVVRAGADPSRIRLNISGARSVRLDRNGDVVIAAGNAELRQRKPLIYQIVDGARREIAGGFVLRGMALTFQAARYDRSRPLVIDPRVVFGTYLAGKGRDVAQGIGFDAKGNIYIAGFTTSTDLPTTTNAYRRSNAGDMDVFVAKFDPNGTKLLYATYLGGRGTDVGRRIAVDPAGNAYIAGYTNSADFPTTNGAVQRTLVAGTCAPQACNDGFVAKLDPTGANLIFSTYLGGSDLDEAHSIAIDAQGNAYVAGFTASTNFPGVTSASLQPAPAGGSCNVPSTTGTSSLVIKCTDAFVTKLNANGTAILYSTYLGGTNVEHAWGIAVDSTGAAYVAGDTRSGNLRVTANAYQGTLKTGTCPITLQNLQFPVACPDGFVAKINPAGTGLAYLTYLGGAREDWVQAISVAPSGTAYVTGGTSSTDFPATPRAFQRVYGGGSYDVFVAALNPGGTALVSSTYLGGNDEDLPSSIRVGPNRRIYVVGDTVSTNLGGRKPLAPERREAGTGTSGTFAAEMSEDLDGFEFLFYVLAEGHLSLADIDLLLDAFWCAAGGSVSSGLGTEGAFQDTITPDQNTHGLVLCGSPSANAPAAPKLKIDKTAEQDGAPAKNMVVRGKPFRYRIVVSTEGPFPVTNVNVTDFLPSGQTAASITSTQGSCSHSMDQSTKTDFVRCKNINLTADQPSATITIELDTPFVAKVTQVSNTAGATAPGVDDASTTMSFSILTKADDARLAPTKTAQTSGKPIGAAPIMSGSLFAGVAVLNDNNTMDVIPADNGPTTTITLPQDTIGIVSTDLNGDGLSDIISLNRGSGTVTTYLSSGPSYGAYQQPVTTLVGANPVSLSLMNFDNDGVADLVVVSGASDAGPGNISVLIGSGTGSFTPATTFSSGDFGSFNLVSVAVGRFNGGAIDDLVVTDPLAGSLGLHFDGTNFVPSDLMHLVPDGSAAANLLAGDFNGDGQSDLIVVEAAPAQTNLILLTGLGDGTFGLPVSLPISGLAPRDVPVFQSNLASGDVDGDGLLDLVVGGNGNFSIFNTPGGRLTPGSQFSIGSEGPGMTPAMPIVGDINGDGKADLAVVNPDSRSVTYFLNQR